MYVPVRDFCKDDNEASEFIKEEGIFDKLSDYELLNKLSVPWS
jgi:hypothetical protein